MCRLLAYVTAGAAPVATTLGEDLFDQFTALCAIHADGWGMAWHGDSGVAVRRSHRSAIEDSTYRGLAHQSLSRAGMVHLRWATDGLAVAPENTHPFTDGVRALAHNGNIAPIDRLERLLDDDNRRQLRGTTDSERYFRYLVQEMAGASDEAAAVLDAICQLHDEFPECSLNAILLTPSRLYAIHVNSAAAGPIDEVVAMYESADDIPLGHADSVDYFAMAYRVSESGVHVISSGVSPEGWTPVPADTVLAIDVANREVAIHTVDRAASEGATSSHGRVTTGLEV